MGSNRENPATPLLVLYRLAFGGPSNIRWSVVDSHNRHHRILRWLLPPVFAVAALAVNGYRFGTTDQAIHLTLLRRLLEPGSMGQDLVASHADAHASLWWHLQAPVVALVGWGRIDLLYLVVYGVCLVATFALLQRIALELLDDRWAAILAPAILVIFRACPAHVHTFEPELVNRTFTHPLVLWALLLLLRGRVIHAAAICGLVFNLHASTAVHTALAVGAGALLDPSLRRRLPAAGGAFVLAAAPLLVMTALRGGPGQWWVDDAWMHVLRWRMPHHLFPWRWTAGIWATAAFQVGLWLAASRTLRAGATTRRCWGAVLGVALCGPVLGTLAAGPVPFAPLLALHLWESWIVLAVLAYLAAAGLVAQLLRASATPSRVAGVLLAALFLVAPEGALCGLDNERIWRWRAPTGDQAALVDFLSTVEHPGGTLLVSPTGMTWLRAWTGQALYVTVKDGGEVVFDREMALQWRDRLADLCGEDVLAGPPPRGEWRGYRAVGGPANAAFDRQSANRLRQLAAHLRSWLLVVPADHPRQDLSPIYGNDGYLVYDLRAEGGPR